MRNWRRDMIMQRVVKKKLDFIIKYISFLNDQIEIDCGEVVNIKGMKPFELSNKINTGYFDFKTLLFFLFFK